MWLNLDLNFITEMALVNNLGLQKAYSTSPEPKLNSLRMREETKVYLLFDIVNQKKKKTLSGTLIVRLSILVSPHPEQQCCYRRRSWF